VGSAIVKLFEQYQGDELQKEVISLIRSLKQSLKTQTNIHAET